MLAGIIAGGSALLQILAVLSLLLSKLAQVLQEAAAVAEAKRLLTDESVTTAKINQLQAELGARDRMIGALEAKQLEAEDDLLYLIDKRTALQSKRRPA